MDLGHLLLAAWMGMGKPGEGGLPPGERDEFEQYLQQYWTERELNLAYLSAFGRALAFSEARSLARRRARRMS